MVVHTQVSGLETDVANLWQAVESLGGLQQVIDKHRWNKVVEMLKIPKIVSLFDQPVCISLTGFLCVSHLLLFVLYQHFKMFSATRERLADDGPGVLVVLSSKFSV